MISRTAELIFEGFCRYKTKFDAITKYVQIRFEKKQWTELLADVAERLYLHKNEVYATADGLKEYLKGEEIDLIIWHQVHNEYASLVADRPDHELSYTFFSSVTRKIIPAYFQNINTTLMVLKNTIGEEKYFNHYKADDLQRLFSAILSSLPLDIEYPLLKEDSHLIALRLTKIIADKGFDGFHEVVTTKSLFFRNKTAYLAGKIQITDEIIAPFLIAFVHKEVGLQADAVITTSEELEVVFSFTRSYFCVDVPSPSTLVNFLQQLMPQKRQAEIYNSLGFNKHGKTILFNDLHQFIKNHDEKLVNAPGIKGMVMSVFTFPSFHTVFKIIKDEFDPVKTVTRKEVLEKYRLVYKHDKYGRLADTHEFDNLTLNKSCFSSELLAELESISGRTVKVKGDQVVIRHTFTERKMWPLNLFIEENHAELVKRVIVDFGNALKELAYANIFPGDMLMKNFGVTRDFRVVFYDYDEITFVTACNFRKIPKPQNNEELYATHLMYEVKSNDIFPEEFRNYLVPQGELREIFINSHPELFEVSFWEEIKQLHLKGYPFEIISYDKKNCLR